MLLISLSDISVTAKDVYMTKDVNDWLMTDINQ